MHPSSATGCPHTLNATKVHGCVQAYMEQMQTQTHSHEQTQLASMTAAHLLPPPLSPALSLERYKYSFFGSERAALQRSLEDLLISLTPN